MSCSTKYDQNIQILSESLVLTAIQESFAKHNFTSATIISKQGFNLSSSNLIFEIRTSLPTTGGLSGQVILIPKEELDKTIKGVIFILENYRRYIGFGPINYPDKLHLSDSENDISHFQIYRFQSKPDMDFFTITMSINGQVPRKMENQTIVFFNKTSNQLQDNFRLVFNLFITSRGKGVLDEVVSRSGWSDCSSMIIDYVKVFYLEINETFDELISNLTRKSAMDICPKRTKPTIPQNQENSEKTFKYFIYVLVFIMAIIAFIVAIVFIKLRKTKIKLKRSRQHESCYDMIELPDILHPMKENSIYSNDYQGVNQYEYISYTDDPDNLAETVL